MKVVEFSHVEDKCDWCLCVEGVILATEEVVIWRISAAELLVQQVAFRHNKWCLLGTATVWKAESGHIPENNRIGDDCTRFLVSIMYILTQSLIELCHVQATLLQVGSYLKSIRSRT
eukprot:1031093-Amphidinium_carterae.1